MKVTQSCPILCDPMDYTVLAIFQTRMVEWVAYPFSRGSSQPRDWTQVSCLAGGFFTNWAIRESHIIPLIYLFHLVIPLIKKQKVPLVLIPGTWEGACCYCRRLSLYVGVEWSWAVEAFATSVWPVDLSWALWPAGRLSRRLPAQPTSHPRYCQQQPRASLLTTCLNLLQVRGLPLTLWAWIWFSKPPLRHFSGCDHIGPVDSHMVTPWGHRLGEIVLGGKQWYLDWKPREKTMYINNLGNKFPQKLQSFSSQQLTSPLNCSPQQPCRNVLMSLCLWPAQLLLRKTDVLFPREPDHPLMDRISASLWLKCLVPVRLLICLASVSSSLHRCPPCSSPSATEAPCSLN